VPTGGFEEVDREKLLQPPLESRAARRNVLANRSARAPSPDLASELANPPLEVREVRIAGMPEPRDELVGIETEREICVADPGLPATRDGLPGDPLEILQAFRRAGQDVDGVLQRERADLLEPVAYLRPEIERLRRELVDQDDPPRLGRGQSRVPSTPVRRGSRNLRMSHAVAVRFT